MVVPGSGLVKAQAEREGLHEIFKAAGDAVLLEPAELREAVQQEAQQLIELRGNLAGATA